IILTGKGSEEVAMEALNQGADRYFKKSGDPKARFRLLAQETIQEITQKRLEKKWIESRRELSKERTLLESLLNNLPISIYFKNKEGQHIRVSQHLVDSLEPQQTESKSDVIGKTDFDLYPDELAEKAAEDDKKVMKTGEPIVNREEHSHTPDGSDIYHSTTKAPLVDEEDNVVGIMGFTQDITERKKAQKKLAREKNLLEGMLENFPASIYIKNREGEHVRVSRRLRENLRESGHEEIIGKTDLDLYPEKGRRTYKEDMRVMKTEEPMINNERSIEDSEGNKSYFSTSKAPVYDDENNVIGLVGITQDITERKKAEKSLAWKRNLLSTLLENAPDRIYFKDKDHRFLEVSQAHADYLGLEDPSKAEGKTDYDFFPDEDVEEWHEEEEEIMETEEAIVGKEEKDVHPDGHIEWVSTSKAPLYDEDGNIIGTFGISRDITEQKKAEKKITFQSNLLQSLLRLIPDSIYFKDEEGRFVEVSESKAEELGMEREEVIGKTDFDFYSEEKAREMFEDDKRVMEEEEPVINKEEKIVTPTGEEWWASVTKVPRYDGDGNMVGTLGISRDITERRRGEEREEFLHSLLSHDIETKNRTATGILELLKERDITEQEKNMINTAINSIKDSSELINRVWTLRKASRKAELSEVELDSKIEAATQSNAELLEDKEIETEIEETDAQIRGGRLLEDLFSNLIEWTVRFGECSKLRLSAQEENGKIAVTVEGDGQKVPEMIKRGIRKDFREGQVKEGGMMIYLASAISTSYKGDVKIKKSELGGARFDVNLRKA
ncbi:hypothetical protein AKJ63_02035, partial [candidate division MSBL1 archaeon SCGC-AAA259D18]